MVDMAGAGHNGMHEAEHLATGERPADPAGESERRVDERLQSEADDEARDEQQAGVGDEVRIVECHLDPVETARYLCH
jgi:hypothetical protein